MKDLCRLVSKLGVFAVLFGMTFLTAGCEGGGDGGGDGDFTGTWALSEGGNPDGSTAWYVHFNADKTFSISNNSDGSGQRVSGTYTVSGGKLTGPFRNPGVGEGRVECEIIDGVLTMDFIEYWHTPNKHVPYAGRKI